MRINSFFISILLFLFSVHSQGEVQVDTQQGPSRSYDRNQALVGAGTVTSLDQGIILELGPDDFSPGNLFDLEGKTLRFKPDGIEYRTGVLPLEWDSDFGAVIDGFPSAEVTFNSFQFPFAGTFWSTLFVGSSGNITFGTDESGFYDPVRDGNLSFQVFGGSMVGTIPIISPLFQRFDQDPDNANRRFVKELTDRVVITWTVSEPYRDVLSFASDPLLNRFQVVLHGDGTIEISYDEIHVEDGIVGIFPPLSTEQQDLDVVTDATDPEIPKYIDTLSVTVSLVGDHSVRFEFQTLGAILPEGDPRIKSVAYRVWVDVDEPFITMPDFEEADVNWGIGGSPQLTYQTSGPGVSPNLEIDGNTIAVTAFLDALNGADRFAFFTDTVEFDESDAQPAPYDRTDPILVTLPNLPSSTVDLSALSATGPSRGFVFEEFHHADLSNPQEAELDLACAVINALGDRFDFLVFYTDFRLGRIVASAPGLGGIGEGVSGVVESFGRPEDWCSDGQLQGGQSVSYIGSPILHASEGTDLVGTFGNYNRQVFLLSHELGHRWLSPMRALVGGQTRTIADTDGHWFFELHAPAAFPITAEADNSPMGGSLWQDNGDGTFTLFPRPFFKLEGTPILTSI